MYSQEFGHNYLSLIAIVANQHVIDVDKRVLSGIVLSISELDNFMTIVSLHTYRECWLIVPVVQQAERIGRTKLTLAPRDTLAVHGVAQLLKA